MPPMVGAVAKARDVTVIEPRRNDLLNIISAQGSLTDISSTEVKALSKPSESGFPGGSRTAPGRVSASLLDSSD